jgi:hypothetical protein
VIDGGLPGNLRVIVSRPAQKGKFGDPGGPAVEHAIDGCLLAPGGTAEGHNRATTVASDWDLYAPEDADIVATDRVTVPDLGVTAEVDGDPKRWPGAGLVAPLRRVKG